VPRGDVMRASRLAKALRLLAAAALAVALAGCAQSRSDVAIGYLGVVCSAGDFILWVFALGRISPTRTAVTINPVSDSIVGTLAIREGIGLNLIAGLIAVAVGIWIATTGRPAVSPAQPCCAKRRCR